MLLRRFCRSWSTTCGDGGVMNLSWTGRSVVTAGTRYLSNCSPGGARVIETVVNGRPITTQRRDSAGIRIGRINVTVRRTRHAVASGIRLDG